MPALSCIRWNANRQRSLRQPGRLLFEDMNAFRYSLCMKLETSRAIIGSHSHKSSAVSKHGQVQI